VLNRKLAQQLKPMENCLSSNLRPKREIFNQNVR